ncbi:MAG: AraC family transcriptional regulator [Paludibacter sp.]|nr:AraC family transcriptional regulator [Paludibacter sp.]
MAFKKFKTMSIDDVTDILNYSIIENYLVSDIGEFPPEILSLEYPTVIKGMAFAFFLRGSVKVRLNSTEYIIKEHTLLTILPESVLEINGYTDRFLFEFLFFSPDFAYELNALKDISLLEKFVQSPVLETTKEQFDVLLEFHSFMTKQYKRKGQKYRELVAKNLFSAFVTELAGIYLETGKHGPETISRSEALFVQFRKLLLANVRTERTVQFYADKMCLSPNYLSQLIKSISHRSIMEWINELTIVYVKARLKTSALSVSQIAEEFNFPNTSFFCNYFKKRTGLTPLQYRKS